MSGPKRSTFLLLSFALTLTGCGNVLAAKSAKKSLLPASILISPENVRVVPGASITLLAIGTDESGAQTDISAASSWKSSSLEIASVNESGVVKCVSSGIARVTVSVKSVTGSAQVICDDGNLALQQWPFSSTSEEFVGPFSNWLNVRDFGAKGDGVADDTDAFQAALNRVMQSTSGGPPLWIPSGTYRITATLALRNKIGFSIIGEDPLTTTMLWHGSAGQPMLRISGSRFGRVLRLTWDGQGVADAGQQITWDGKSGFFPTDISETDEIFTGSGYGIRLGWVADIHIERARFNGNTAAGVSVEDWNGLGITIRDSTFTDCAIGATNLNLAGNFEVYDSLFLRSKTADMMIYATPGYISARRNTSVGSKSFFVAKVAGRNTARILLEKNIVANTASSPVVVGNQGPLSLVDNTFITAPGLNYPVVLANDFRNSDVLSLRNTYDNEAYLSGAIGRIAATDDVHHARGTLSVSIAGPAPFHPNLHRQITEIAKGATTDAIQSAIGDAKSAKGSRPVVHLQNGSYSMTKSLRIEPGSDVQLVGDGPGSVTYLNWAGDGNGPVIVIEGPSTASIKDIGIGGSDRATGIQVAATDNPGSVVRMWGVRTTGDDQTGISSEGLDHTSVDVMSSSIYAARRAITVSGGPVAASGSETLGRVAQFGDETLTCASDGLTFDVSNGGNLIAEDFWRDDGGGNNSPQFINLHQSNGHLSLQQGAVFTATPYPFNVGAFAGDVTLQGLDTNGGLASYGDNSRAEIAAIGLHSQDCNSWSSEALGDSATFVLGRCNAPGDSGVEMGDTGSATADRIRATLSRFRSVRQIPYAPVGPAYTDVRLFEVFVQHATTAIELSPQPGGPVSDLGYTISDAAGRQLGWIREGLETVLRLEASTNRTAWTLVRNPDGSYRLQSRGGPGWLTSQSTLNSTGEPAQWIITPDGSGAFTFQQANGHMYLSIDKDGNPVVKTTTPADARWFISLAK
jgi:hypothetical protein